MNQEIKTWYLAQLRPNQLERAKRNLERQDYVCFAPRRPVTKRRNGRLIQGHDLLFPGYLFVQIPDDAQWGPVNSTYGVVRLVMRTMHEPQRVPVPVMADLFDSTDENGVLRPPRILTPGERVRITLGPMTNFVACVERMTGPDRVGILLEMMGQAVRAELPSTHLRSLAG